MGVACDDFMPLVWRFRAVGVACGDFVPWGWPVVTSCRGRVVTSCCGHVVILGRDWNSCDFVS